jgi:16S rRNA (guanine527-N7)-methyltransferase
MIRDEDEARDFVAQRCDAEAMDRLDRFAAMLREENERHNLVSAGSLDSLWRRHLADSAQLLDHVPKSLSGSWLDLGSGAGFPGLVIAAMRPQAEIRLVESRRLRIAWLEQCIATLGLPKCTVEGARVETLVAIPASYISARAFAPLPKILAVARRFSTADTRWLLPKGRSAAQEVADLPSALQRLFHVEQSVTDPEAGIILGRLAEVGRK